MEVYFVHAESFKLDGGATFGVVPKSMWSKFRTSDDNNMIDFSSRNLLVVDEKKVILFDTGIGNKQDEKYLGMFQAEGSENLVNSIRAIGFSPLQITDVVFTHLHFDHCGGAFRKTELGLLEPVFKNANYWCSKPQWLWAINPNFREKASYMLENMEPIFNSGSFKQIEKETYFTKNIFLKFVNGHTEGQIVPIIKYRTKTLMYTADFIPTIHHISLPYIASYDTRPLITLQEKSAYLREAVEHNHIILFQHDAENECCTVQRTDKGIRVKELGTLEYFLDLPSQNVENQEDTEHINE